MKQIKLSTDIIIMIASGILLIGLGIGSILYNNHQSSSPFDIVHVSAQDLDESDYFIPLIQERHDSEDDSSGQQSNENLGEEQIQGCIPEQLIIPSIDVDAPIVSIPNIEIEYEGQVYYQWLTPDYYAVGWHGNSAFLGEPGNTVLSGHHNVFGEVFADLYELQIGDRIEIISGDRVFEYRISANLLLPERYQPIETRLENARWILPSDDERVTLVTCWPADSNTHRVVIVASPIGTRNLSGNGTCNQENFHLAITPTPRLFILPTATATIQEASNPPVQKPPTSQPSQTPISLEPTSTPPQVVTDTPNQ